MPGPTTEVLGDDLKEMRADIHRAEVALTTAIHQGDAALSAEIGRVHTSLSAEIARVNSSLSAEINKVNVTVSKLIGEFSIMNWLVGLTLATALSGVVSSAYWAGSLASRVTSLEGRFDKVDTHMSQIDSRLDRLESHMSRIDGHLERIEAGITRVIGGAATSTPSQPRDKPSP